MIGYRTNAPVRAAAPVVALPVAPADIAIDVEHCLWAAAAGLQPIDVIEAVGWHWSPLALPTWADALQAVRIASSRLAAAARHDRRRAA